MSMSLISVYCLRAWSQDSTKKNCQLDPCIFRKKTPQKKVSNNLNGRRLKIEIYSLGERMSNIEDKERYKFVFENRKKESTQPMT